MQKVRHNFIIVLIVELLILVFQLVLFMRAVNLMQGNGRIVNYTGIIRGATQRLVKNELYGAKDNNEIERLDNIFLGLQTGQGIYDLIIIRDDDYTEKLSDLADEWKNVKIAIYEYRNNPEKKDELYKISEEYFISADKVVAAAEKYADGIAGQLLILQVTISVTIFLMLCLLCWQIIKELKKNRMLNSIAYVDPHTGLPNKRCCEDKMTEIKIEPGHEVLCILFDLNELKYANDTFGHLVGDVLISSFATLLRKYMPSDMFVGRFGGDEFIGIQSDPNMEEITNGITNLMNAAGQTNVGTIKQKIIISFAYGYALSSQYSVTSVKSLMDIADKNMYKNKLEMKKLKNQ